MTKLSEKPVRISDTRKFKWEAEINTYLTSINNLKSESAKSHRFAILLNTLLGINPGLIDSYCQGIEKYIVKKGTDRILRGEVDNLYGNVIIEFESNLIKKRSEAEYQLKKYTAIIWSDEENKNKYICIATDGCRFIIYTPILSDQNKALLEPEDVLLKKNEEIDFFTLNPEEIYYWLERYFSRKETLIPNTENIVNDFGIKSHAYQTISDSLLKIWEKIKIESPYVVIYDSWERYLRIVYGNDVSNDELFIRHTYLANLAKLLSWIRISKNTNFKSDNDVTEIIQGNFFKRQGIDNFIEEDFFSWIGREKTTETGINIFRLLLSLLQNYNLREISEDVLKTLYQELVDPETRHDLGEFYTPDWLAHKIVKQLLDENPEGSVFDPACGSGTFLYLTIKEKRKRLSDSANTLKHILQSVYGADVHPLAVTIAKTNYVLALGDLLNKRKGLISIPIYLTDTLRLPEKWIKSNDSEYNEYSIDLYGNNVDLPEEFLKDITLYDHTIELIKEYAKINANSNNVSLESLKRFLKAQNSPFIKNDNVLKKLFDIVLILKHFIETNQDSIWAFILKNSYKPLFFKQKFDFVIGNPPWIAFRYLDSNYQKIIKHHITQSYKLLTSRGHLITHIEIASLFLVRSADLYLKPKGRIAFVMPRSIFNADQHDELRKGTFTYYEYQLRNLLWQEIWDLEEVEPLFNVPSCVVFAKKDYRLKSEYPVNGIVLKGKLKRKNDSLISADNSIQIENVNWSLEIAGKHSFWTKELTIGKWAESYYKQKFSQGASIGPRSFWFIDIRQSQLGYNENLPLVETSKRALLKAKKDYQGIYLKDNVEKEFLYATLLSSDLLSFGHLKFRLIILPLLKIKDHLEIIDSKIAKNYGYIYLSNWLNNVESEWIQRRNSKAKNITSIEWLNYRNKLINQENNLTYTVLYNSSGTNLASSVLERNIKKININNMDFNINGFISESGTFFYDTNSHKEALFLSSILNSNIINKQIKPLQARGLWGPRHIQKKVFELPIPKFDEKNKSHIKLAELGISCSNKINKWLKSIDQKDNINIGSLRGKAREIIKEELEIIDDIVEKILKA